MTAAPTKTLDVIVQRVGESDPKPSDLLRTWLTRPGGSAAVVDLAGMDGGLRQAALTDADHVIVECDELLPEILSSLSSRNQPRDLAERLLRVHVFVSPAADTQMAIEWAAAAASAARAQRIVLWYPADAAAGLGDWKGLPFARRVLGAIEVADKCDPNYSGLMAKRLDALDLIGPRTLEVKPTSAETTRSTPATNERTDDALRKRIDHLLIQRFDSLALRLETAIRAIEKCREDDAGTNHEYGDGKSDETAHRVVERVTRALTELEQRLGESAEQRLAARLDAMADAWTKRVKENIVDASTQFIVQSNAAFGTRAEHFTRRIETLGELELERDRRFQEVTRNAMVRTLREWLEPRMNMKSRWFGIGAVACGICTVAGMAIGLAIPRIVG